MTESAIVASICAYLEARGHFFYRHNQIAVPIFNEGGARAFRRFPKYSRRGVPDIILVKDGTYIGIECKTERGKISDDQTLFAQDLVDAGGKYFIVRSIEDVEKLGL
jgi:hypothetical protein